MVLWFLITWDLFKNFNCHWKQKYIKMWKKWKHYLPAAFLAISISDKHIIWHKSIIALRMTKKVLLMPILLKNRTFGENKNKSSPKFHDLNRTFSNLYCKQHWQKINCFTNHKRSYNKCIKNRFYDCLPKRHFLLFQLWVDTAELHQILC